MKEDIPSSFDQAIRRFFRGAIPLLLLSAALYTKRATADIALADEPSDIHVSVEKLPNGSHHVEGSFTIDASTSAAWDILTDYDHMSAFVSSIRYSRRVQWTHGHWLVEQIMVGKAGIFRKRIHLMLEVAELRWQKIVFKDVLKKSFKDYSGTWEIVPKESGTITVSYKLQAAPAFYSPDFVSTSAFSKSIKLLLKEVREEIRARHRWETTSAGDLHNEMAAGRPHWQKKKSG